MSNLGPRTSTLRSDWHQLVSPLRLTPTFCRLTLPDSSECSMLITTAVSNMGEKPAANSTKAIRAPQRTDGDKYTVTPRNTQSRWRSNNAQATFREIHREISEAQARLTSLCSLSTPGPDTLQKEHLALSRLKDRLMLVWFHLVRDDSTNYLRNYRPYLVNS